MSLPEFYDPTRKPRQATQAQVGHKLARITARAAARHPGARQLVQSRVLAHLAGRPGYLDAVSFEDLPRESRNVVGPAIRSLMLQGLIVKTGQHKRSQRPESNGREIWEYRLAN